MNIRKVSFIYLSEIMPCRATRDLLSTTSLVTWGDADHTLLSKRNLLYVLNALDPDENDDVVKNGIEQAKENIKLARCTFFDLEG